MLVRGILPHAVVEVVQVRWYGTSALELTYKDARGRRRPVAIGGALVVPIGLLRRLCGDQPGAPAAPL